MTIEAIKRGSPMHRVQRVSRVRSTLTPTQKKQEPLFKYLKSEMVFDAPEPTQEENERAFIASAPTTGPLQMGDKLRNLLGIKSFYALGRREEVIIGKGASLGYIREEYSRNMRELRRKYKPDQ
jgi:hypothetical protein